MIYIYIYREREIQLYTHCIIAASCFVRLQHIALLVPYVSIANCSIAHDFLEVLKPRAMFARACGGKLYL